MLLEPEKKKNNLDMCLIILVEMILIHYPLKEIKPFSIPGVESEYMVCLIYYLCILYHIKNMFLMFPKLH